MARTHRPVAIATSRFGSARSKGRRHCKAVVGGMNRPPASQRRCFFLSVRPCRPRLDGRSDQGRGGMLRQPPPVGRECEVMPSASGIWTETSPLRFPLANESVPGIRRTYPRVAARAGEPGRACIGNATLCGPRPRRNRPGAGDKPRRSRRRRGPGSCPRRRWSSQVRAPADSGRFGRPTDRRAEKVG
jgi:hypothetical protein